VYKIASICDYDLVYMRVVQIKAVLSVLQEIEPGLDELKITRKDAASKCPLLMKVLKNHTRSSDYMIQLVKSPLCTPLVCDCMVCALKLWKPPRMPVDVYEEVHSLLFPLPMPEESPRDDTGALHYMSFEENMTQPFTDEHQPSKISKRLAATKKNSLVGGTPTTSNTGRGRGNFGRGRGSTGSVPPLTFVSVSSTIQTMKRTNFPLGHIARIRGVVLCMDCGKPRCVYSAQAIAKMKPHGEYSKEDEIYCRFAFISSVFFNALTS